MQKFIDELSEHVKNAFEKAGYERELGRVSISNRPDLCEYQSNGAMAGAKKYKKAPMIIANEVGELLKSDDIFKDVEVVAPGFINFNVKEGFLASYLNNMLAEPKYGVWDPSEEEKQTIVIDYGGPNVAKPLHVGHLRPAIIGESIKRIARYAGHDVYGDVHLGDWGLPMGQIITELSARKPELVYFDENYEGEYPDEPPFTISELEEIYPFASGKCKTDEEYKKKALLATNQLQKGRRGYRALWKHILNVSVNDLKKNYEKLGVEFDLWKGESDVDPLIPEMVKKMKEDGFAYISDGALVVDIKKDTDKKELPPCMILKSDGAANYETTDLATIIQRERDMKPDAIIYVVDKRQELHFEQVFRCARKTGIVRDTTSLEFVGFGTMNGKDGHAFKTRDGGVLRLEYLLKTITDKMFSDIEKNNSDKGKNLPEEETRDIALKAAIAALKYGDLSNQASKDYIFDIDRFTSFEGDTGPYILYTMARIKSILKKYIAQGGDLDNLRVAEAASESEKKLEMNMVMFNQMIDEAFRERAPHKVCAFIYGLANQFNTFYHENNILGEQDEDRKKAYIALISGCLKLFEASTKLLGFEAPERM